MNCHQCLKKPPEFARVCAEYPLGWPGCGGYISTNGMAKHDDAVNPERERQQQQAEYLANLRRLGYRI